MRQLVVMLLLLLPFPAMAEAPGHYRAETPLTIRAGPDPAAEAIGELAAGAAPVEITAEAEGWGRIAWRGADGWVPLGQLVPFDVDRLDAASLPVGLVCGGTEPFWSLAFSGPASATFATPDAEPVAYAISGAAVAAGRPYFPVALSLAGPEATAVALVRPLACSDGMSDMTYGWTLDLVTQRDGEAILLSGCCRLPIDR